MDRIIGVTQIDTKGMEMQPPEHLDDKQKLTTTTHWLHHSSQKLSMNIHFFSRLCYKCMFMLILEICSTAEKLNGMGKTPEVQYTPAVRHINTWTTQPDFFS
jgi:hypothetical protein